MACALQEQEREESVEQEGERFLSQLEGERQLTVLSLV